VCIKKIPVIPFEIVFQNMCADDVQSPENVEQHALQLRAHWIDQPFGVIRFWGFGVVRPNDQSFVTVSVLGEADRLDLTLVHESRQGLAQRLSVWSPQGLRIDEAHGLVIARAARVSLGDCVAWAEDDGHYRVRTPQGEGSFPMQSAPAVWLGR
jgi:hypothetical protein